MSSTRRISVDYCETPFVSIKTLSPVFPYLKDSPRLYWPDRDQTASFLIMTDNLIRNDLRKSQIGSCVLNEDIFQKFCRDLTNAPFLIFSVTATAASSNLTGASAERTRAPSPSTDREHSKLRVRGDCASEQTPNADVQQLDCSRFHSDDQQSLFGSLLDKPVRPENATVC